MSSPYACVHLASKSDPDGIHLCSRCEYQLANQANSCTLYPEGMYVEAIYTATEV